MQKREAVGAMATAAIVTASQTRLISMLEPEQDNQLAV
jgi:hypothetical protein